MPPAPMSNKKPEKSGFVVSSNRVFPLVSCRTTHSRRDAPSCRSLYLVQISSETVFGRWNGIEQHDCADLSAVACAVGNYVHKHFFARHATRRPIRKRKIDLFR